MKYLIFLSAFFLCFCSASNAGVNIAVSWSQSEEDTLLVTIANTSAERIALAQGFTPWGRAIGDFFQIWRGEDDANGKLVEVHSPQMASYSSDIVYIEPGKSLSGKIKIREQIYGESLAGYMNSDYIFWLYKHPAVDSTETISGLLPQGGFLRRQRKSDKQGELAEARAKDDRAKDVIP